MFASLILLHVVLLLFNTTATRNGADSVLEALKEVDSTLEFINHRWQVNEYPRFLKAASISDSSWQIMKNRFLVKIIDSLLSRTEKSKSVKFVISFVGSSVTAGHDSPYNSSFPMLTRTLLSNAFAAIGITLEVRNGAVGNNACIPYDVCSKTFAGSDADVIVWEQSYNCKGYIANDAYMFELFIRQTLTMPHLPIIVFTDSHTPNWEADECVEKSKEPLEMTDDDKELLRGLNNTLHARSSGSSHQVAKYSQVELKKLWNYVLELLPLYKSSGIQFFDHTDYEAYKCRGPYVSGWACCSSEAHPSLLGKDFLLLKTGNYDFVFLKATPFEHHSTLSFGC